MRFISMVCAVVLATPIVSAAQFPTTQFLKKIRVAHVAILPKGSLAIKPTALPEGQNGGREGMNFQLLSRWIERRVRILPVVIYDDLVRAGNGK